MEHEDEGAVSPVAAMTARVAALWRAQGEEFLQVHHEGVVADVDRLRTATIVSHVPTHRFDTERLVERLRQIDAAAVERLAAGRSDAVIDLTGAEPVVRVPARHADAQPDDGNTCRRCNGHFNDEELVRPPGDRVRPLCVNCAFVFAGVRRSR